MSSTETQRVYSDAERARLSRLARESIRYGLQQGCALPIQAADYPQNLQAARAAFVTLNRQGGLRGCIGHLEPVQPLVADVVQNAFAAAFQDPRFPPLQAAEEPQLEVHISVLSLPQAMTFDSEADLLRQIRPGEDGLILQDGPHRGTFLPSVWESLPEPRQFLEHLKIKAGLPSGHWSDRIRISRYQTESWSDLAPGR